MKTSSIKKNMLDYADEYPSEEAEVSLYDSEGFIRDAENILRSS